LLTGLAGLLALGAAGLALWRWSDHRADAAEAARLVATQPADPARFDPAMVAALPEAARRYFLWAIEPGTPLYTVAQFSMTGKFSMGTREAPAYMAMAARQTLAAPEGFVWSMTARRGAMLLSGSDAGRWTRFWMMGLIPVARMGGTPDHSRAAFGRYVAEAAFWTPAALLPGPSVAWEADEDPDRARAVITHGELAQVVELHVAPDGRLIAVVFPRWTDANPQRIWREQPFGGILSDWRTVDGFRVPFHVEAGNNFGTADYFPFFLVDLSDYSLPGR
ncbi:MAG: DUF6544 family protein, partial [Gemmobacter sp.]